MALTNVKCVAPHPIDLADGRPLAPGDWAKVDLDDPHVADLVENGHLAVPQPAEDDARPARSRKETP